jgi:hypothetical protein
MLSQKSMPSFAGSKTPLVSTSPVASSSITSVGGTRPPVPTTVAAGSGFPLERTVVVGVLSSVVERFGLDEPPGLNSVTKPFTFTASPTFTDDGADDVKTKMPSDVASSESGLGSCT